jgi:hypothetical protein
VGQRQALSADLKLFYVGNELRTVFRNSI